MIRWLFVLALLVAGCTPHPVAPCPDAADSAAPAPPTAACSSACATLATLGCAEGTPSSCPAAMQVIDERGLVTHDGGATTCADVAAAASQDAVRALGIACTGPGYRDAYRAPESLPTAMERSVMEIDPSLTLAHVRCLERCVDNVSNEETIMPCARQCGRVSAKPSGKRPRSDP